MFLGYPFGKKRWLLYDIQDKNLISQWGQFSGPGPAEEEDNFEESSNRPIKKVSHLVVGPLGIISSTVLRDHTTGANGLDDSLPVALFEEDTSVPRLHDFGSQEKPFLEEIDMDATMDIPVGLQSEAPNNFMLLPQWNRF